MAVCMAVSQHNTCSPVQEKTPLHQSTDYTPRTSITNTVHVPECYKMGIELFYRLSPHKLYLLYLLLLLLRRWLHRCLLHLLTISCLQVVPSGCLLLHRLLPTLLSCIA